MESITQESYEAKLQREREEEKERNEKIRNLIKCVSKILGFTLEKEKDDDWRYVSVNAGKGDESIHFSSNDYSLKERIRVLGNFPKTGKNDYIDPYRWGEKRHEITVSIGRRADQIAKDIERRFLPRYRELLKRAQEQVSKANVYQGACERNLEAIKGAPLSEEEKKRREYHLTGDIFGSVKVTDTDANLELHSVPIEAAKKIVRLIANL
jgi:hypothetical protein